MLVSDEDAPLLSALRAKRRAFAEAQGVPAYIIFNDKTLIEMAEKRPATLDDFARISGVGAKKLENYGRGFLEVINGAETETPHPARRKLAGGTAGPLYDQLMEAQNRLKNGEGGFDKPVSCSANVLAASAAKLSAKKLGALMSISDNLAKLNYERFQAFEPASTPDNSKPAALSFAGDTSGLYGLLKPRDAIQPYRLEMGSRLKTGTAPSLYAYWGDKIALKLNAEAEAQNTDTLINCASQEYFGAVDLKALKLQVITPTFLEDKPGGPKIVSFFAKQARGAMARFIIQNRITNAESLQDFDTGGYTYLPERSTPQNPVFFRSEEALNAFRKAS